MTPRELELKSKFPIDTWVLWEDDCKKSVSDVFVGWEGNLQPFGQLNIYDIDRFTALTYEEVMALQNKGELG